MGLKALEFTDSLTDSPAFRENLHAHEKELESTSSQIKGIIKHVKEIVTAARLLSRAQRSLAESLENFHFECIGNNQTDDELIIMKSLREFGRLISSMEDERDRMLEKANDQFIKPLEEFRKKKIGDVKSGKKTFDKQTTKFCQSQERYLNLSTKKQDNVLQEADAQLDMEQRFFCQASLDYVLILQEVQECKKFECVETLLGFMYSWLTFYHQGHEIGEDCKPYLTDLQKRIQNTRENFEATRDQTKLLKDKMLESRKAKDPGSIDKVYARQGYLFFMEKKALGSTWNKYYCTYEKKNRKFTMIGYNQISGKIFGSDEFFLKSCTRRASESIEKRFCFDVTPDDRPGITYTLQALSEEDRRLWLEAMDGKEPTYGQPGKVARSEETCLDEVGLNFVQLCINELESRGLEEQGLYRLVGVTSKVSKLLSLGLDRRKSEKISLSDRFEWETKTITSALKKYIWNLPEPIMTYEYHEAFITAAQKETVNQRIADVHALVHRLPYANFRLLNILCAHLKGVAAKSEKNKMTVSNLGVCFGPTLLRPEEESVAGIIESKFCKVVVEILIDNCEKIFGSKPTECEYPVEPPTTSNSQIGRAHISPIKHAIVSSYNNGPKPVIVEGAMSSSWDTFPPTGLSQSNITVNSLHSSSHSSSSNHSTGEPHPLGYSVSQPTVLGNRGLGKQNRVGIPGVFDKGTSYSQPYLHSGADCNASNSSSSSESVASWPGPIGVGHGPSNMSMTTGPVMPPPYQPPPNLHLTNGKDYSLISGIPKGVGTRSPFPMTCARTLYACTGEHDGELSFEPNEIITNVRPSCEPGWLEGTLRGKTGLVPENYVEPLQ